MSNKVSVELGLNVAGYKQGMKDAKDSTTQYNTETRKVKDQLGNFTGELRKAKKEVQNLAMAYSKLSAEEKRSQFGLEMKKQLDKAKESAAELIDLQGDIQTELKNMASDTKTFDMLSEGFGTVLSTASGALGAIAMFTGEEEDARQAVLAFTTAQSVLTAATKIQNALQMQSNTMLAVTKVQNLAAAAAINVRSAAEGKGVIATKAATVAQALFNKVAYANPYVILAAAVLGLVTALGAFVVWSNKSAAAQEEENKAKERAKAINDAYYNAMNDNISETMTGYIRLQSEWKNLKSEQSKNEWIKDNEEKFHALGVEINNTADAENFLVSNTDAVKQAFMARARAAALAAKAAAEYQQALNNSPKAGDKMSVKKADELGLKTNNRKIDRHVFSDNEITITAEEESKLREKAIRDTEQNIGKLYDEMTKEEQKAAKKLSDSRVKSYKQQREKTIKSVKGGKVPKDQLVDLSSLEAAEKKLRDLEAKRAKISVDSPDLPKLMKEIEDAKDEVEKRKIKLGIMADDSLEEAENRLKELEEKRAKISIYSPDLPKLIKDIEDAKKEVERRKIKLGIQLEMSSSELLSDIEQKMNKELKDAEAKLVLATLNNDSSNLEELAEQYDKLKQKCKEYSDTKKLITEGPEVTGNKNLAPAISGDFDKSVDGYNTAISALQDKLNTLDLSSGLDGVQEQWELLTSLISKYKEELQAVSEANEEASETSSEKANKSLQKRLKVTEDIADATMSAGDAFSALSQLAEDDPALNIAGIIAEAIAKIMLGFAQASAQASSMTPFGWLAFTIAGLSTALATVASIKSAAEAHAQGGLVGGSSYSGDNVLTRLNSGEMVLNKHQQQNLFNAINSGNLGSNGGPQTVQVQGVIRGTDILLVSKNTNKALSRSGHNINI